MVKKYSFKENLTKHLEALSQIGNLGNNPKDGFLRAAWSKEETAAMKYIQQIAEEYGFITTYDQVGNLFIRTPGSWERIIQTGSHLDTVEEGGNYDGVVGVIGGLEAIKAITQEFPNINSGFELIVWRGEESGTYNIVYKGSKSAFGLLNPASLQQTFKEKTLRDAMIEQGINTSFIEEKKATISQENIDKITAHIEMHIEQGNLLEKEKKEIGIVTSIRGPYRFNVFLTGEFDHSGATPLGVEFRKDANLALAYIIVELDTLAKKYLDKNKDLVQTLGVINSDPALNKINPAVYANAITKVSGFGYFKIDIRSNDNTFKAAYVREAKGIIKGTANKFRVQCTFQDENSSGALEQLDKRIQKHIEDSCKILGYSYRTMPSGAGHDCTIVAKQKHSDGSSIPVGMIFIPCKGGKSHCKEEYASIEDITKGTEVLTQTLYSLAQK